MGKNHFAMVMTITPKGFVNQIIAFIMIKIMMLIETVTGELLTIQSN